MIPPSPTTIIPEIHKKMQLFTLLSVTLFMIACSLPFINGLPIRRHSQPPTLPNDYIQPGVNNDLTALHGHTIGLITNPSGQSYSLTRSTIDLLMEMQEKKLLKLIALFAPEHGVYGDKPPGQYFADYVDPITGLPVYSLYNNKQNTLYKPLPYMLKNITMLVLDIQDVGMRPFTFISTMCESLMSASENHLKFTILDRINLLNGNVVAGPMLELKYKSFIGIYKMPIVTGMTMGELGRFFDGEMNIGMKNDLIIIPVKDDSNGTYSKFRPSFREIRNTFSQPILYLPPSPNLPTIDTVELYSGMVLFETLYNVSIGRGTTNPFTVIGAPFIDSRKWANLLLTKYKREMDLYFSDVIQISYPTYFIPSQDIHTGLQCEGIRLVLKPITNRTYQDYYANFLPVTLTLMKSLMEMYDLSQLKWRSEFANSLIANDLTIKLLLDPTVGVEQIVQSWQDDLDAYQKIRSKYLIYSK